MIIYVQSWKRIKWRRLSSHSIFFYVIIKELIVLRINGCKYNGICYERGHQWHYGHYRIQSRKAQFNWTIVIRLSVKQKYKWTFTNRGRSLLDKQWHTDIMVPWFIVFVMLKEWNKNNVCCWKWSNPIKMNTKRS